MLFNLHADYVKAATPRIESAAVHRVDATPGKAPPGRLRARLAVALASTARRVDGESARRAVA